MERMEWEIEVVMDVESESGDERDDDYIDELIETHHHQVDEVR